MTSAVAEHKIDGTFYPLQMAEWLRAKRELRPAEKDVLYYLRILDPFGDRELELSVSAIARDLGVNKGTVSRALKVLASKKWIDFEITHVKVKLLSKAQALFDGCPLSHDRPLSTDNGFSPENVIDHETTGSATGQPARSQGNDRRLKRALRGRFRPLKTLNTKKDFKQTFSQDREGEKNAPQPIEPQLIEPEVSEPIEAIEPEVSEEGEAIEPEPIASPPICEPSGLTSLSSCLSGQQILESGNNPRQDDFGPPAPAPVENFVDSYAEAGFFHPTEKLERAFRQEPWGSYSRPDPGFIDYIKRVYLPETPSYKANGIKVTTAKAKGWLSDAKHVPQRYDKALIVWEEFVEWRAQETQEKLRAESAAKQLSETDSKISCLMHMLKSDRLAEVEAALAANPDWGLRLTDDKTAVVPV